MSTLAPTGVWTAHHNASATTNSVSLPGSGPATGDWMLFAVALESASITVTESTGTWTKLYGPIISGTRTWYIFGKIRGSDTTVQANFSSTIVSECAVVGGPGADSAIADFILGAGTQRSASGATNQNWAASITSVKANMLAVSVSFEATSATESAITGITNVDSTLLADVGTTTETIVVGLKAVPVPGTTTAQVVITYPNTQAANGWAVQIGIPSAGPTAAFTHSESVLTTSVVGTSSTPVSPATLSSYDWDWGDGSSHGSGSSTTHTYSSAGTYTVVLTVTDSAGSTNSVSHSVTVTATAPTAAFTHSETAMSTSVNGTTSSASTPATITGYDWDWGDGTSHGSGSTASHTYSSPGTYTVTLKVTDSNSLTGTTSHSVTAVSPPTAAFTHSETPLTTAVDGTTSSAVSPATITGYDWDWGDSSGHGSGSTASHSYAAVGTYTVVLTVTDSNGLTATASHSVTVSSPSVQVANVAISGTPFVVPKVQVASIAISGTQAAPSVQVAGIAITGVALLLPSVQVAKITITGTRAIAINPIVGQTVEAGQRVTLTAVPSTTPDSWLWTQTSGPTVQMSGSTTAAMSFTAPGILDGTSVTFSVTATLGGVTSPAQTVTVTVLSETRFVAKGGHWLSVQTTKFTPSV